MRILGLAVLLFFLTLFGAAPQADDNTISTIPRVRFTDRNISTAMSVGITHSPTFRDLLARIERADVIVHIDWQRTEGRTSGFTQFIGERTGWRYVRITVRARKLDSAVVALLGHELQHTVEVAEASWVRDESAYAELYRTIGHSSCAPPQWCFDTTMAVEAGERVYADIVAGKRRKRSMRAAAPDEQQRHGDD